MSKLSFRQAQIKSGGESVYLLEDIHFTKIALSFILSSLGFSQSSGSDENEGKVFIHDMKKYSNIFLKREKQTLPLTFIFLKLLSH